MKEKLTEIAKILWEIPNSSMSTVGSIINPIETVEQADRMLEYLKENKENLKIGYLIKYKHEIIDDNYTNILRQIANILWEIPLMNKDRMIGIMNPLDNETQAKTFLKYLEDNKDNLGNINISELIRKSLEISNKI